MIRANLYVEGKTDKEFLEALIAFHFNDNPKFSIYILEGNYTRIIDHSDRLQEGFLNLFILDSDKNSKQNVATALEILVNEEKESGRDIRFDTFLIENNLEHLVKKIVPQSKNGLWNCIDEYAKCNEALESNALLEVDSKTKVYIYVNAHNVPHNYKKKAFHNPEIWDLNHKVLEPLLEFLKTRL